MKDSIWNHNPAKFQKECKRLRALCRRIESGEEPLIDGCLKMRRYAFWMKEGDHPDWEVFGAVSSEVVSLPVGEQRQYWNPEVLAEKDRELAGIESVYRRKVLRAVRKIERRCGEYLEQAASRDVRRPGDVSELTVEAARLRLGVATGQDLARSAEAALLAGATSMHLALLVAEGDPILSDAVPLFERGLADLSIEIPPKAEACWIVLRHHLTCIATGTVRPRAGVRTILEEVYYPCGLQDQVVEYVGDSHDLQEIIGNYYGIDDIEERPNEVSCDGRFGAEAIAAVESHIKRLAAEWLRRHGG